MNYDGKTQTLNLNNACNLKNIYPVVLHSLSYMH